MIFSNEIILLQMKITIPMEVSPITSLLLEFNLCKDIIGYIGLLYLKTKYKTFTCEEKTISYVPRNFHKMVDNYNYIKLYHTSPIDEQKNLKTFQNEILEIFPYFKNYEISTYYYYGENDLDTKIGKEK